MPKIKFQYKEKENIKNLSSMTQMGSPTEIC